MLQTTPIPDPGHGHFSSNRRKLLLVEDDAGSAALQRAILEGAGWEVHVEAEVGAALRFLRNERPDLVLTDLKFPLEAEDGFDMLLQQHGARKSPRVIVVSGQADSATRSKAERLGARDFIAKPFAPAHYRTRVDEVMREIERGLRLDAHVEKEASRMGGSARAFEISITASELYLLALAAATLLFALSSGAPRFF